MAGWTTLLKQDPIVPLLDSGNEAVVYFTKRDILLQDIGPVQHIWKYPEVLRILKRQLPEGYWKYPGKIKAETGVKYNLIGAWKQLRYLVDQYGMDRSHPAISSAAEYIFSCQTGEGDIRGILANQYAPYYTGAIMSLLIKAGYADDPRIEKGFRWLLEMRQDDGGWVIGSPGLVGMRKFTRAELIDLTSNEHRATVRSFERSKPFSAAGTGMVLRAFAAHPRYRQSNPAVTAAKLLKSKLFKQDNWSSYGHPDNWLRFQFPFWWTNLVSALDTISLIGLTPDADIRDALDWLVEHQEDDSLWNVSYSTIHRARQNNYTKEQRLWITLAICRILIRFQSR